MDSRCFQHTAGFVSGGYPPEAATCLRPPFTGASVQSFALRLTPPLNLPAPGRRQTLYIDFVSLQSPVFLLNSRLGHFSATFSRFTRANRATTLRRCLFFQSYEARLPSS